ncbi:MAG TPA: MFS transporter [Syntrophales bacterium]|nr:MFS transporter [Syntrophales bacterium]HOM07665.1 MFS transporter [Syntrophales bacterium]HOO00298.1 MFS transporter [Syntrophales bacterium]HPC01194.1 MFS transporter [Syntrophales bacterium]HPQ07193.1 MFS transporter [Syntrophales bacterium]
MEGIVNTVAFTVFLVRLEGYMVNLALPTIASRFGAAPSDVSWVILSYLLFMTSAMLVAGKLADRLGLRRLFLTGYAVFSAASLLGGCAPTLTVLEAARALQGIGAAMMITTSFALVVHHVPPQRRGWAFGLCALANSLGIMAGAPLGGFVTGAFSWRGIFFIKVAVGALVFAMARRSLPADEAPPPASRLLPFDWAGGAFSFLFLSTLVFGLDSAVTNGLASWGVILTLLVSLTALGAFIYSESRAADPILRLRVFQGTGFFLANATTILGVAILAGGNFLLPFYLERLKGLTPQYTGAVMMIYSIVYMPLGLISGSLTDRFGPRPIATAGLLIAFPAPLLFALTLDGGGVMPAVVYLVLLACAYGFFFAANNTLVLGLSPPGEQGIAAGVYSTVINVGMILGVCLFEGVFTLAGGPAEAAPVPSRPFAAAFTAGAATGLGAFLLSLWGLLKAKR